MFTAANKSLSRHHEYWNEIICCCPLLYSAIRMTDDYKVQRMKSFPIVLHYIALFSALEQTHCTLDKSFSGPFFSSTFLNIH